MPNKKRIKPENLGATRNKFEKRLFDQLVKTKGVQFKYESDKFPYMLPERKYLADFSIIVLKTGRKMVIEGKGYFDGSAQSKMRAVKLHNPDIDIRFVFQDASKKVRKGAKSTYADWADKYGFPWAEGLVPKEWLV